MGHKTFHEEGAQVFMMQRKCKTADTVLLMCMFILYRDRHLTRSLREPVGPCTKSMEVSESRMERVNRDVESLECH